MKRLFQLFAPFCIFAALCCFAAEPASAQGSFFTGIVWRFTPAGAFPASGATVTVCTALGTGAPCTPTISLFKDAALSQPVSNPLPACSGTPPQLGCLDGLGNFSFFALTAGPYTYSVSGTGLTAYGPIPISAANTGSAPVLTVSSINGDIWMGGSLYATLGAALAAVPSGGTVRIAAGTYTTGNSTLNLVSGLDIECSPNNQTILQAGTTLNAAMFSGTSINNFRIAGCVIDGNRSGNANQFSAFSLTNVTKSKLLGNHIQNFSGGRVVYLSSGSNFNTVQDNEIDHYGPPLPAVANGTECIALAPSGSGAGVQDNDIIHNYCHDGNGGINIYNSNAAASVTANSSRNRFLDNKVQANANDAFLIYSNPLANPVGSLIQGNLWEGNIARCNGWPANGTGWDSTNCPPGLLQTGASGGQGVGFNLNSNQADQNQFIGNRSEFNFFEGGDDTPQILSTVNTSNGALGTCVSNCVQATSGGAFLTTWKANSAITIGPTFFLIASVQSSTVLTLTTAPGTQTGVQSDGFTFSRSIWKGNYFFNNGNGAPAGGQGAGLAIQGGYVTSGENISAGNAYSGFYDQGAVYVTHSGDHSLFNCRVAACNEFNAQVALRPHYTAVVSDSASTNNALFFSGMTNNGYAEAAALCTANGCGTSSVQDQGTNDDFFDGKTRGSANTNGGTHALCFSATAGTGCINYGGGSGGFTATLPGANGPLAVITTTQKNGSGAGNYTGSNTAYANLDTTNLCQVVTIPTGWKLNISASGGIGVNTAAVFVSVSVADIGTTCGGAGVTPLKEQSIVPAVGVSTAFALNAVIVGDGAAHAVSMQAKTSAAADTWFVQNSSATLNPTMTFILTASN